MSFSRVLGLCISSSIVIFQKLKSVRERLETRGLGALNALAAAAGTSHLLKITAASMTANQIKLGSPFAGLGSLKIEGRPSSAMDHSA